MAGIGDAHDQVSAKDLKRFCAAPARGREPKSTLTSICGECCLHALHVNLVKFAEVAVTAHNAARFQECDDFVNSLGWSDESTDAEILGSFVPDPEYLHKKMATLQSLMSDLGCELEDVEQDPYDGTFALDEILDRMHDVDFSDMSIADMKFVMKHHGISTGIKRKISYARGAGVRMHAELTGHDVEMGKEI